MFSVTRQARTIFRKSGIIREDRPKAVRNPTNKAIAGIGRRKKDAKDIGGVIYEKGNAKRRQKYNCLELRLIGNQQGVFYENPDKNFIFPEFRRANLVAELGREDGFAESVLENKAGFDAVRVVRKRPAPAQLGDSLEARHHEIIVEIE